MECHGTQALQGGKVNQISQYSAIRAEFKPSSIQQSTTNSLAYQSGRADTKNQIIFCNQGPFKAVLSNTFRDFLSISVNIGWFFIHFQSISSKNDMKGCLNVLRIVQTLLFSYIISSHVCIFRNLCCTCEEMRSESRLCVCRLCVQ